MQRDDTRQSRHAVGARRRGAVERARPAPADRVLRRLPRRRAGQHARRRRPLSGLQRGRRRARSTSRTASTCAARAQQERDAACRRRASELLALTAYVAHQSRGLPIAPPTTTRLAPFRERGTRAVRRSAWASSTSPAPTATTTTGAGGSAAARSRRRTRPAIRSTAWNGRASARCSGACATA